MREEMQENRDHVSLNKYIAETGVCSRRAADKMIEEGRVRINDTIARKGNRVSASDKVYIDGILIGADRPDTVYIALHKPKGIVCTTDEVEKDNIIDYINFPERIFPIGRLDKDSEGLILLTNDGDIVNKILRASNAHEKEYVVTVNKEITSGFLKTMSTGVPILDTVTKPCVVKKLDNQIFSIILTQGLNRQIRRMCEFLNYKVTRLVRNRIMHLTLDGIPYGKWRFLSSDEVNQMQKLLKDSKK
ncbi:MAG: 23S rRNA pseudouridine(2604) synthase RluF [Saprospiraceae bacterium]